jgi:hypothetical protein
MTQAAWVQPPPTKRFAAWYRGAWYAEGETPERVRHEIRVAARACPSSFWRDLWRGMEIKEASK